MNPSRMPPLRPEHLDDEQQAAAETFLRTRGVAPDGPFAAMLRSPETMVRAAALGEHLRYHSTIAGRLCELAILIIARRWAQDYEWHTHAPLARAAGVGAETIEAIADGRRPMGLANAEQAVYDFLDELDRNARVSDATYSRTLHAIGEAGIIDLCAVNGYYTLLAMTMNAVGVGAPRHLTRFPD
ncbi:MAG TPA: carboxymuconolactone decarboxylase family protein [Beijerinckiaceae bacterium]|jgi:4-carboxymuconolactone decarboxylase|nr:carboxymuconolactone decarboxylase family protein [Beijerinckiaceae bacterium]